MRPRISLTEKHRIHPRMDITALVDCVFLLLVFFLLTSTFVRQRDLAIDLAPVVTGDPVDSRTGRLEIVVDRGGGLYIENEAVDDKVLVARFEREGADPAGCAVRILADQNAPAGRVLFVLDSARAAGLEALDLVGKTTGEGDGAP